MNKNVQTIKTRRQVLMMANQRKYLDYVARYAAEHNWRLALVNDGQVPHGWRGDGALLSFSRSKAQMEFAAKLAESDVPCVAMSCSLPKLRLPRVLVDYAGCAKMAATCLYSKGYRNFMFCTSERLRSAEFAHKIFAQELHGLGYGGEVPWVVCAELLNSAQMDSLAAYSALLRNHIMPHGAPLAIWCFSDSTAANILDAAVEDGVSIPDDLGILATNDNPVICENQVMPLSSINPDYRAQSEKACQMLDCAMSGQTLPELPMFVPLLGVSERETTGVFSGGEKLIRQALVFMQEHVASSVGVDDVARSLHVSPRKLERLFRDKIATSPAAEFRAIRLRKAKSLLRNTDWTLDTIADACGFSHGPHFANIFKNENGETPTAWRARWTR